MKSKIIASTLIGLGFLLGASALSALAVWTGAPAGTPPNCPTNPTNPDGSANADYREGCNAPINAGATGQSKFGPLSTFGFSTIGGFNFLPSARLVDQPKVGQVLMADDSPVVVGGSTVSGLTIGKIKWGSVAGSGGSGSSGSGITFITPVTLPTITSSYQSVSVSSYGIPANAKAVILEGWLHIRSGNGIKNQKIMISPNSGVTEYVLVDVYNSSTAVFGSGSQGIFPISNSGTFQYKDLNTETGTSDSDEGVRLIGYVM